MAYVLKKVCGMTKQSLCITLLSVFWYDLHISFLPATLRTVKRYNSGHEMCQNSNCLEFVTRPQKMSKRVGNCSIIRSIFWPLTLAAVFQANISKGIDSICHALRQPVRNRVARNWAWTKIAELKWTLTGFDTGIISHWFCRSWHHLAAKPVPYP